MFTLIELSASKTIQDVLNAVDKTVKIKTYQRVKQIVGIIFDALAIGYVIYEVKSYLDYLREGPLIRNLDRLTLQREWQPPGGPLGIYKVGLRAYQDGQHDLWAGISLDIAVSEGHAKALPLKYDFAINVFTGRVAGAAGANLKLFQSPLFKLDLALRFGRGFGIDSGLTNRSGVALVLTAPGSIDLGGFSYRAQWNLWNGADA
jgi:uncharacterized protein (UPF0297 family)